MLIDKDEGVHTCIGGIVLLPSIPWVVPIKGDVDGVVGGEGFEGSGTGVPEGEGDLLGNRRLLWLLHVVLDDVSEVGNEEEVEHVVVAADCDV